MNIGPEQSAALIEGIKIEPRLDSRSKQGRPELARNREGRSGAFSIPLVQPTITEIDRRHLKTLWPRGWRVHQRAQSKSSSERWLELGVAGAVAVSSGTAALHLALMAMGVGSEMK